MSEVNIDIREDPNHPEGGHAVIRLNGLKVKPKSDSFVIEPAGGALGASDLKAWPGGERTPLRTKLSPSGFEIMIGPDVVESPVLLPGTPVVIKVPSAGISREVLWPDITPLRRQKVKRIITSTDRCDALLRMNAKAVQPVGQSDGALSDNNTSDGAVAVGALRGAGQKGDAFEAGAGAEPVHFGTGEALVTGSNAAITADPGRDRAGLSSLAGADGGGATLGGVAEVPKFPSPEAKRAGESHQASAAAATQTAVWASSGDGGAASGVADGDVRSGEAPPGGRTQLGATTTALDTRAREMFAPDYSDSAGWRSDPQSFRYGMIALAVALIAAGVAGYLYIERFGWPGGSAAQVAGGVSSSGTIAAPSLFDAFKARSVSPRGNTAARIASEDAVRRAFSAVSGKDATRDTKEAAFWLRQYLAKQLGDKQTLWALTQLGSTYARPADSPPDYVTARNLWEIAAALGDPVASCFLGGVHETGLGVPVSKPKALDWYLRAQKLGGCRALDAAIARVK